MNITSALHSAATNGAQSIGDYNAGITGVMNRASADPTQQLVGSAQSYMNNGATAAAVAYDCSGVYVETDY